MKPRHRCARPIGAAILVVAAALALSGCGRKGGLALPPAAGVAEPAPNAASADAPAQQGGNLFNPNFNENGPAATKGRKKPFVLDPLLD